MRHFFFFFCLIFAIEIAAFIDLNKMEQPFVLEAKRIHVPGYPDAFNPSIVYWKNRLLMTFRSRNSSTHLATLVGFTWLDKNFNPVGKPQLLHIPKGEMPSSYIQDPRLCVVNDTLYMAYSDLWEDPKSKTKKRKMYMAEIEHDGVCFRATQCECFLDFDGKENNKFEKNWVPFNYQEMMLLAYTISPHKIFLPVVGEKKCVAIADSHGFNSWNWGVLRGGTPALLVDNHYLAFFHSSATLSTMQSEGQSMTHYFMGAYLFENQPPFSIKKMSPQPIVSKEFYNGKTYQTWKPLRVIFPCGFIYDKNYIWVSYGRQDHEAWIVKLDKTGLFKSLIPFHSNNK